MFHDKNLTTAADAVLLSKAAFQWNSDACKLALMVQFYKSTGQRLLPVDYLKRHHFTAREWELATKGRRPRSNDNKKRLLSKDAVSDGLEHSGIIREVRQRDAETGRHTTFWLIGDLDDDASSVIEKEHAAICAARFEKQTDYDHDEEEQAAAAFEAAPSREVGETKDETSAREAYDHGYAVGDADGYQRAIDSVASVLSKVDATGPLLECSLSNSFKGEHAKSVPVPPENPNDSNLKQLLKECREQGNRIGAHYEY